ncbi:MAG: hypothetical protein Q4F25_01065 [Eubacteriales bacterium]|nr:hypothetical protein [Eubacteriales bacterium]
MENKDMIKVNEEELNEVNGGAALSAIKVRPITPIWVRVTSPSLNCRYTPNGKIAKIYEKGHRLKVDGITADGAWYRLLINDPRGGTCYAYIAKKYTAKL